MDDEEFGLDGGDDDVAPAAAAPVAKPAAAPAVAAKPIGLCTIIQFFYTPSHIHFRLLIHSITLHTFVAAAAAVAPVAAKPVAAPVVAAKPAAAPEPAAGMYKHPILFFHTIYEYFRLCTTTTSYHTSLTIRYTSV